MKKIKTIKLHPAAEEAHRLFCEGWRAHRTPDHLLCAETPGGDEICFREDDKINGHTVENRLGFSLETLRILAYLSENSCTDGQTPPRLVLIMDDGQAISLDDLYIIEDFAKSMYIKEIYAEDVSANGYQGRCNIVVFLSHNCPRLRDLALARGCEDGNVYLFDSINKIII